MLAPPPRFIYSPLASSSSHASSPPKPPPSTAQIALYSCLAVGIVLVTALLYALLHHLHARRTRERSREVRKRAMIAAAATKAAAVVAASTSPTDSSDSSELEASSGGKWIGGRIEGESGEGINLCCYCRIEDGEDGKDERPVERTPGAAIPRRSFVSRSLRGSRRATDGKKESIPGVRLVENIPEVRQEEKGTDATTERKEDHVADKHAEANEDHVVVETAGAQSEVDDEPIDPRPPPPAPLRRQSTVRTPNPCLTTPAVERDPERPAPNLESTGTLSVKPSIPRLSTKSDDMFQRRNKAKSLELLHLKNQLAYPAAVHSPPARVEKTPLGPPTNRTKVVQWIREGGKSQDSTAKAEALQGREGSWQTLDEGLGEFGLRRDETMKTLGDVSEEIQGTSGEQDEWQDARLVLKSQWGETPLSERSTAGREDEWEDVSDAGSLATRSSDLSLGASPTRVREL